MLRGNESLTSTEGEGYRCCTRTGSGYSPVRGSDASSSDLFDRKWGRFAGVSAGGARRRLGEPSSRMWGLIRRSVVWARCFWTSRHASAAMPRAGRWTRISPGGTNDRIRVMHLARHPEEIQSKIFDPISTEGSTGWGRVVRQNLHSPNQGPLELSDGRDGTTFGCVCVGKGSCPPRVFGISAVLPTSTSRPEAGRGRGRLGREGGRPSPGRAGRDFRLRCARPSRKSRGPVTEVFLRTPSTKTFSRPVFDQWECPNARDSLVGLPS